MKALYTVCRHVNGRQYLILLKMPVYFTGFYSVLECDFPKLVYGPNKRPKYLVIFLYKDIIRNTSYNILYIFKHFCAHC